jgi:hypothetical protein
MLERRKRRSRCDVVTSIFVSHAGSDWDIVDKIVRSLRDRGVEVYVDRNQLVQGDNFIEFMERSLRVSDYCLLLWSRAASTSKWVRVEWEAAFHRTVEESRSFLIVAMLEEYPVPELLRPRLQVNLFPDPEPGIVRLLKMWQRDVQAGNESARPVAKPSCLVADDVDGTPVYISSAAWGKTIPLRVKIEAPAAFVTRRIVSMLGLPDRLDHDGKMGVRFSYDLVHEDTVMTPSRSLLDQGVGENDLVWLQTTLSVFGSSEPNVSAAGSATYRGDSNDLLTWGRQELLAHVVQAGLGV